MATNAIYIRPSDNVAPNATVTIQTGTDPGDPQYGPMTLVDLNPARVAKINSTTFAWLFDYGSAQRIDIAGFIHGTFETTSTVRFQGNATDSWGAPSFDVEVDIQPWYGVAPRRWPHNHWVECPLHAGYTTTGYRYWRLICSGNSQNGQLGQVVMSPVIREMNPDLRWEYVDAIRKRNIVNETSYGSKTTYPRGTAQWLCDGDQRMTEALFRSKKEHFFDADGTGFPWLLVPSDPEQDGSPAWQEHGECYFVRLVEDRFSATHTYFNVRDRKFLVEELSRGLRPGT